MRPKPNDRAGLVGIILAAGESKRLGQPKQLVQYEGEPLIRRLVQHCLRSAIFERLIVVLGSQADEIAAVLNGVPVEITHASDWNEGMSASVRAGIAQLQTDESLVGGALLMVCDQPHLDAAVLKSLAETWHRSSASVVSARYNGRPGVPVIFDRRYFASLSQLTGDSGARSILRALAEPELHQIDLPKLAFDLDHPQDLEAFRQLQSD
ncbi:MAG: nucleotidyltransferase family protein [Synoicihabitans sp.]